MSEPVLVRSQIARPEGNQDEEEPSQLIDPEEYPGIRRAVRWW
jgi:hypothetical protein